MRKRFLSLAIAICMVAAMLPTLALSASALEVNETISYYFAADTTINAGISKLLDATGYNTTTGRYWKFIKASNANTKNSALMTGRLNGDTRTEGDYIALEISVPEDGSYSTEFYYYKLYGNGKPYGCKGLVYILPEGTTLPTGVKTIKIADIEAAEGIKIASVDYSPLADQSDKGAVKTPVVAENVELKKGNNILIFVVEGKGANATSGTATDYYTTPTSLTLTLTKKASAEDEKLTEAFELDDKNDNYTYIAPSVAGITEDGLIEADKNADGSYNLTAPATKEGEPFLYWAMGMKENKRIVSFEETLVNYVPEGNEVNYLVAVYEGDVDTTVEEYYNRNGQRIATRKAGEAEPAKPSMAGYGEAKSWVNVEGTNVWYAEYEKTTPGNVTVTVDGDEQTVPYGTKITCTADPEEENFKCWTKSDIYGATDAKPEIVSVDGTYEFYAWENCTVTAEYEEHTYNGNKMKIIIDNFTAGAETGVMAEFIGLGSAVEKGIMFTATGETEATKIAMTTKDNQFTVVADKPGTYVGYAILAGGDAFTLITDGLYEHN